MFRTPVVVFDLVPDDPASLGRLPDAVWRRIQMFLLEIQPARTVKLIGRPPRAIRVVSYGSEADVAPAVLSRIEGLCGSPLRVELA